MRGDAVRRTWTGGGMAARLIGALAVVGLLAGAPEPVEAQSAWSAWAAPALSRRVGREGGPALGAIGGELRLLRGGDGGRSGWGWGGSLAWHGLGEFGNPAGDARRESQLAVGVRAQRGGEAGYLSLGADLQLVLEDQDVNQGVSRDPGVGAYLGVGRVLGATGPAPFVEVGLHGVVATGELTHGNGAWVTLQAGLVF